MVLDTTKQFVQYDFWMTPGHLRWVQHFTDRCGITKLEIIQCNKLIKMRLDTNRFSSNKDVYSTVFICTCN